MAAGKGEERASIFDRRDETGFYGERVANNGERGVRVVLRGIVIST